MTLLVNAIGILLLLFIVYWFWGETNRSVQLKDEMKPLLITVENGIYNPDRIEVKAGKPLTLQFMRRDATGCPDTVVFTDFNISASLPLNALTVIKLPTLKPGVYEFTCPMSMYRGKLFVSN